MNKAFEKIIEKLEELNTINCQMETATCRKWDYGTIVKAIEIVKQEAEKFGTDTNVGSNGWIPCSERFPEEDGFYLATLDGEIVGEEKPFSGLAEFENGKWIDDEEDYHCVLAWQPLPKPFQKGE